MSRLVMKFGGTSVATTDRIRNVAQHVKREVDAGHEIAVVVSAMAGKTNELVGWCKELAPLFDQREYDAVVASGEQVTAGLLAIALQEIGVPSRSWLGWQTPIYTNDTHGSARIEGIDGAAMSTGSTQQIHALCRKRVVWSVSHLKKCLRWLLLAQKFCRCAL